MRLFIAVDFSEEKSFFESIKKQIDESFLKLKFTKSYHLTLKFLGEVNDQKLEMIKEKLKDIRFSPFSVISDNIGFFPNNNYIKVIWLGLKDNLQITELQQKIDDSLSNIFPRENRFHPHITLARVKFVKDKVRFKENISEITIKNKKFNVGEFKLIKSTLNYQGPVYEDVFWAKAEALKINHHSGMVFNTNYKNLDRV